MTENHLDAILSDFLRREAERRAAGMRSAEAMTRDLRSRLPTPRRFRWSVGIASIVVATTLIVLVAGIRSFATPMGPPALNGMYRTESAVQGDFCVLADLHSSSFVQDRGGARVWWWTPGASRCASRASDVVSSYAKLDPHRSPLGAIDRYDLVFRIPLMGNALAEIRLGIPPSATGESFDATVATGDGVTPIKLVRVEELIPPFNPR